MKFLHFILLIAVVVALCAPTCDAGDNWRQKNKRNPRNTVEKRKRREVQRKIKAALKFARQKANSVGLEDLHISSPVVKQEEGLTENEDSDFSAASQLESESKKQKRGNSPSEEAKNGEHYPETDDEIEGDEGDESDWSSEGAVLLANSNSEKSAEIDTGGSNEQQSTTTGTKTTQSGKEEAEESYEEPEREEKSPSSSSSGSEEDDSDDESRFVRLSINDPIYDDNEEEYEGKQQGNKENESPEKQDSGTPEMPSTTEREIIKHRWIFHAQKEFGGNDVTQIKLPHSKSKIVGHFDSIRTNAPEANCFNMNGYVKLSPNTIDVNTVNFWSYEEGPGMGMFALTPYTKWEQENKDSDEKIKEALSEVAQAQAEAHADWSCGACTYVNKAGPSCVMCTTPRPNSWACSACTMINDAASSICEACQKPNQKEAYKDYLWQCYACDTLNGINEHHCRNPECKMIRTESCMNDNCNCIKN